MNEINLLPLELRQDLPLDWKKFWPFILLGVLITLIITLCLIFSGLNLYLAKQNSRLDYQLIQLQSQSKQAERIQANIVKLETQKKHIETILEKRKNWSTILGSINDILPHDIWLTSLEVTEEEKLLFNGTAQELTSVGMLVLELGNIPYFTDIELIKAEALGDTIVIQVSAHLQKGSDN